MKKYLTVFVIAILCSMGCKKEKSYSLVGKWRLKQIFLGYSNGGDFGWKNSSDNYYYDMKGNDSIYTDRFVSSSLREETASQDGELYGGDASVPTKPGSNVRLGSKAALTSRNSNFRFASESR